MYVNAGVEIPQEIPGFFGDSDEFSSFVEFNPISLVFE